MSLILIRQLCQVNHILTHQQMILLTKHQRKSGNLKRENLQISILQCLQDMGAVWESDQDEESDSFWIGCAGKSCKCKKDCHHECNWWVRNRYTHIYYDNTDSGERNLENCANGIKSSKKILV